MILKAKKFLFYRVSPIAVVTGKGRDGSPTARFDVLERHKDEIFRAPPDAANALLADGSAVEARLTGKLEALAEATLHGDAPCAAALAGFNLKGWRTWHANIDGGEWQPAPASIGSTRNGLDAVFRSAGEIEAQWGSNPKSIPLFSYLTEHGYWRAYIWRAGGLTEIAISVNSRS